MQAGPKRHLILCSSKKRIKKTCKVSTGNETLRVPLPLLWSMPSCSDIYQNVKDTDFPLAEASDLCDTYLDSILPITYRLGDSVEMKLFSSSKKGRRDCLDVPNAMEGSLTLNDLTKLLKKLTSTIQELFQQNFRFVSCNKYKYRP